MYIGIPLVFRKQILFIYNLYSYLFQNYYSPQLHTSHTILNQGETDNEKGVRFNAYIGIAIYIFDTFIALRGWFNWLIILLRCSLYILPDRGGHFAKTKFVADVSSQVLPCPEGQ